MTRAEVGLVVFIFVLVYAAGLLPKIVDRVVSVLAPKDDRETK